MKIDNDVKIFFNTICNLMYIFLLTGIGSWIFDATFMEMLLPISLAVIVSKIVAISFKLKSVRDIQFNLEILEKKLELVRDKIEFEVNSRNISDNLNEIKGKVIGIDLMEIQRDMEKLKKKIEN